MGSFSDNLRRIRNERGLSLIELSLLCGIDAGSLSKLENDKGGFSKDGLSRIAKALSVPISDLFNEGPNVGLGDIGTRKIPVLDYVQAGKWSGVATSFRDEEMQEFVLTVENHSPSAFGLVIRGDSMRNPNAEDSFQDGDLVVIEPALEPRPGDYVVAVDSSGEATFKQFRAVGINDRGVDVFELVPLNNVYPKLRSDRQEIRIVGTMVEHRRFRRRK